ncbi:hypothetical protein [Tardiphaga sp. 839_C3_N1_4]|uniref:hypothetical protein n=1 Tax=Tardiphaga sp. 839_C3_N1_4 TaxID=3240761 RepID=UPI003F1EA0AE
MPKRMKRTELYDAVWSMPLGSLAPQFGISDVGLKKTCAKFDIPVPERGYWARRQAGKPTTQVSLPVRAAGMDDQIVVGGRNRYGYGQLTEEEILGPLPEPPSFPEDLALVRDRARKIIGRVSVPKALSAPHPAIARLIAQDDVRRQKQAASTYTFSWETPLFDSPLEQRRLRLLNTLFLAVARCGGKAEVRGREARDVLIAIHQTNLAVSLDRPPKGRGKDVGKGAGRSDPLRFAILVGYGGEQERAAWQDDERGRLESLIQEMAIEVVTSAEVSYRESCIRQFEWRVSRKAQIEQDRRNRQLQIEHEERERQQQLEQAKIDRLLNEAASLRQSMDIRAYVEAVKSIVMGDTNSISVAETERWANWALAQADRIDPVRTARFLNTLDKSDDNK